MDGIHALLKDMENGRLARGVLDVSPA